MGKEGALLEWDAAGNGSGLHARRRHQTVYRTGAVPSRDDSEGHKTTSAFVRLTTSANC